MLTEGEGGEGVGSGKGWVRVGEFQELPREDTPLEDGDICPEDVSENVKKISWIIFVAQSGMLIYIWSPCILKICQNVSTFD